MSRPSRGERFILDLSDDEEGDSPTTHPSNTNTNTSNQPPNTSTAFPTTETLPSFIGDIIERTPSAPKPPTAPIYKQTPTGFPVHKKRTKVSAFKAARGGAGSTTTPTPTTRQDGGRDTGAGLGAGGMVGLGNGVATLNPEDEERRQIDAENQRKLASMSPEEIEQEQKELLAALDPSLVAMLMKRGEKKKTTAQVSDAEMVHKMKKDLTGDDTRDNETGGRRIGGKREVGLEEYLRRANIDDGRGDTWVEDVPAPAAAVTARITEVVESEAEEATVAKGGDTDVKDGATKIAKPKGRRVEPTKAVHWLENDEAEPEEIPDLQPASDFKPRTHTHPSTTDSTDTTTSSDIPTNTTADSTETVDSLHFPRPPTLPDLDPSSPNFLQDLHTAYFPSLPSSPSTLAWLAPLPTAGSPADLESSYSPSQTSIPASSLRFDFKGQLLPPRISRAMPTDRGLHHHSDAPEAGGYTVPELARLMRSSVAQQRGVAVMVLGRVLFRLGRGEWGQGGEC
ncbi:hypothetical protein VE03_03075 [Pseudogymnoascus sp. 23342-1-I1]|nr:hypothetical protein VE03_03075 [Pseudogymnoascus sp. 23342-1-I1]